MKRLVCLLLLLSAAWADVPGTYKVPAPIAPPATNSPFAGVNSVYVGGGTLTGGTLANYQDLNYYPSGRRNAGQLAVDKDTKIVYILGNDKTTWTITSVVSGPGGAIVTNIAQLVTLSTNVPNAVVLGYRTPGDGGDGTYFLTNTVTGTNAYGGILASTIAGYSWVLDVQQKINTAQFGTRIGSTNYSTANRAGMNAAMTFAAVSGYIVEIPSGNTYVDGSIDCTAVSQICGVNAGGSPIQSTISITSTNSDLLTNLGSYTILRGLDLRGASPFIADSCSSGYLIDYALGGASAAIENVNLANWYGGVLVSDCTDMQIRGLSTDAVAQPMFFTSGTQATVTQATLRGERIIYSDYSTPTTGSYAGSTNVTVSSTNNIAVGDLILPYRSTDVPTTISSRHFWRKVTAIPSSTSLTIDRAWPQALTNITQFVRAVGIGLDSINCSGEGAFTGLNIEWGGWRRLINAQRTSISGLSVDGVHLEGLVWDYAGTDVAMFDGSATTFVFPSYIDLANSVIQNASSVSIASGSVGLNLNYYSQRDIESAIQPALPIYAAKFTIPTYPFQIIVGNAQIFGGSYSYNANNTTQIALRQQTYNSGQYGQYQQNFGLRNMQKFFFTSTPNSGAWIVGDSAWTPVGQYICKSTGVFGGATGQYKVRTNSQVIIPDTTLRGVATDRYPLLIGGTNYIVDWVLRQPLTSFTNSVVANAGDTWIQVSSLPSANTGDWAVIDFGNTNYEDIRIDRLNSGRIYLDKPLTYTHTVGSTIETGLHITAPCGTDVTSLTAAAVSLPVFVAQGGIDQTTGRFDIGGAITAFKMGSDAGSTALDLYGGTGGNAILKLNRTGLDTFGFKASGGLVISDETLALNMFTLGSDPTVTNTYTIRYGTTTAAALPHNAQLFMETASGTDVAGGLIRIRSGLGTGTNVSGTITLQTGIAGSTGTTVNTVLDAFQINSGVASTATNSTTVLLQYWNGTAWTPKRIEVGAADSGGTGYRMLRVAN